VSRFQKIFLASSLVAAGFGVAKFLGQPVLPTQMFCAHGASPGAPSFVQAAPVYSGAPQAGGGVRLVPDSTMSHAGAPGAKIDAAVPQPPRLGTTLAPVSAMNDKLDATTLPRAFDFAPISSAPVARLRNEAPRSVGIDPQSPAAIRRVPSDSLEVADPYKVSGTKAAPPIWSAPQLLNGGYNDSAVSPHTAVTASYAAPAATVSENQVAPPPWPVAEEANDSRTHVVVDGDSLERIASRYLSDPRRSREIFELNRAVLSAPDLLPIGAELKIPERVVSTNWDRHGFQPNSANATPNRDVARESVTSARPGSSPEGIIPRAQLAPPVMVQ
jgi:nucleoid-associated protein YgaU